MKLQSYALSLVSICMLLANCSKKNISLSTDERYKTYSQQLEMYAPATEENYSYNPTTAESSIKLTNPKPEAPVFATKKANFIQKRIMASARFQNISKKIAERADIRKIAENMNRQKSVKQNDVSSSQIITGIIVGIIGLVLIGIAGSTGAAALVYTAGIVLFVAGVILLLLGIF